MTHTYPCSLRPRLGNNPLRELAEMTEYGPFHPEYNLIEEVGPEYYRTVIYRVVLGGRISVGFGGDEKDAKHAAAKRMLELLDDDGGEPRVGNTANVDDDKENNHQNVETVDVCQKTAMLEIHADDDQHQTVDVIQNLGKVGIHDDNGEKNVAVDESIINVKPKLRRQVGQTVRVKHNNIGGAAQSVRVKLNIAGCKR